MTKILKNEDIYYGKVLEIKGNVIPIDSDENWIEATKCIGKLWKDAIEIYNREKQNESSH